MSYSILLDVSQLDMLIKLLFDSLLLICLRSIQFFDQPEESRRVEDNFFLSTSDSIEFSNP